MTKKTKITIIVLIVALVLSMGGGVFLANQLYHATQTTQKVEIQKETEPVAEKTAGKKVTLYNTVWRYESSSGGEVFLRFTSDGTFYLLCLLHWDEETMLLLVEALSPDCEHSLVSVSKGSYGIQDNLISVSLTNNIEDKKVKKGTYTFAFDPEKEQLTMKRESGHVLCVFDRNDPDCTISFQGNNDMSLRSFDYLCNATWISRKEYPDFEGALSDPAPSTTTTTQEEEHSYIVNVNSGKLHLPDCSSVDQMNEENKRYITCTRSEAVSRWSPCQRCCP